MSMKVGGPAKKFYEPENEMEAAELFGQLSSSAEPFYIIGNGSNIIVRDEGFAGSIIHIRENLSGIEASGNVIRAQAGATLREVSEAALERSLQGFEFASGIPGSVGGACCMNAGAYGGEIKDIVRSVTAADRAGNILVISGEAADFSYRHSLFSSGKYLVLAAEFELEEGDEAGIRARMEDLSRQRREKQPLDYPSCGSTFKRPEGYFAGKLIMDSGLKGARVGGASVSEKHCGFVVNDREGTAEDVLALIELVKKTVLEKQGVALECEVKIL